MKTKLQEIISEILTGVKFSYEANTSNLSGTALIDVIDAFVSEMRLFVDEERKRAIKSVISSGKISDDDFLYMLKDAKELFPAHKEDFTYLENLILNK